MNPSEAQCLCKGDRVWWTDPDHDLTSREYVISFFKMRTDDEFVLVEEDGSVLQGYLCELEKIQASPEVAAERTP
jgi:hypothetical protein